MKPTISDVHVSTALSDVAMGFFQTNQNLVWPVVFPPVYVQKRTDTYYIWSQADLMRIETKKRAPGTQAAQKGVGLTTSTYTCDQYALALPVPREVEWNADPAVHPDRVAMFTLSDDVARGIEQDWMTNYFTTSKWTDYTAGTDFTAWDQAGSDPIRDVHLARNVIRRKTRMLPNVLVVNPDVDIALKNHADVKDRVKSTSNGALVITEQMLAQAFGVAKYVVASGSYNSAAEGATAVYADMAGKHALLVYASPTPSIDVPSGGYTFMQTAESPGGTEFPGLRAYDYYEDKTHTRFLEVQADAQPKLTSSVCGILFGSAVS